LKPGWIRATMAVAPDNRAVMCVLMCLVMYSVYTKIPTSYGGDFCGRVLCGCPEDGRSQCITGGTVCVSGVKKFLKHRGANLQKGPVRRRGPICIYEQDGSQCRYKHYSRWSAERGVWADPNLWVGYAANDWPRPPNGVHWMYRHWQRSWVEAPAECESGNRYSPQLPG